MIVERREVGLAQRFRQQLVAQDRGQQDHVAGLDQWLRPAQHHLLGRPRLVVGEAPALDPAARLADRQRRLPSTPAAW